MGEKVTNGSKLANMQAHKNAHPHANAHARTQIKQNRTEISLQIRLEDSVLFKNREG